MNILTVVACRPLAVTGGKINWFTFHKGVKNGNGNSNGYNNPQRI